MNAGYGYSKSDDLHHLVSAVQPEFTLCGNAFDCDSEVENGDEDKSWVDCAPSVIDCPLCAAVVLSCRGVKVAKELR